MTAALFDLGDVDQRLALVSGPIRWTVADCAMVAPLLTAEHYLGPAAAGRLVVVGRDADRIVAAQIWKWPTARELPADGTWLELSRWCLTPAAGPNAGSRQHRAAVRMIRTLLPVTTTLVSYSDRAEGHTGALYRACNWSWCPTWMRLRPPPTGAGRWAPGKPQNEVKDRWVFALRPDPGRSGVLAVKDDAAVAGWLRTAPSHELAWAARSITGELREAARKPLSEVESRGSDVGE